MSPTRLLRTLSTASRCSVAAPYRTSTSRTSNAFAFSRFLHTTPANMVVHEVKSLKEFQEHINKTGEGAKPVIVDSYAEWCGPCKAINPILEKFSNVYTDVTFLKFDVDQVPDLGQELGVRAMPTFYFFNDGNKVKEVMGANPPAIEKALKEVSALIKKEDSTPKEDSAPKQ